jgi:hypothetical protein
MVLAQILLEEKRIIQTLPATPASSWNNSGVWQILIISKLDEPVLSKRG